MKKFVSFFKSLYSYQGIILVSILSLAAFLRLYRIGDYIVFLGDQGRDVLTVYGILHGKLTLLGPTSSVGGFFLGPIYYYFMAPFLWLSNYNPVGPAIMVALFGIATVFLVFKFTSELFNKKVALVAALIYAISPIVVTYSRFSWNPNPLPFFSLLILYILYKNALKENLKMIFVSGILLGIAMQLHYLATFLAVIMASYLLLSEFIIPKVKLIFGLKALFKKFILMFVGFIIGWSPLLAFEFRHGFPSFSHMFDFIVHSGNTGASGNFIHTISDVFFRLFAGLVFAYPGIDQLQKYTKLELSLWAYVSLLISILSVILLFVKLFKTFRKRNSDVYKYLLLSLWLVLGIVLFGFYKKSIYEYYFAFMFPLPFILVANLLLEIAGFKKNKIFLVVTFVALLGIFIINILGLPFRNQANRQLNQMQTIAEFVMTKTNVKPFNFALISSGNTDHAYRYFFTIWKHPPTTIQYKGIDPQRNSVTDQLFVVCESPLPCQPLGHSLWEIAGFGQAEVEGHWKISVVEVYKLVPYKAK